MHCARLLVVSFNSATRAYRFFARRRCRVVNARAYMTAMVVPELRSQPSAEH